MLETQWSRCARGLLVLCYLLSIVVNPCVGETISHTWEVEYMHWAPDCIESVVMAINRQFPGPEIKARVGDTLKIAVTNKLSTEGLVIHWHGITQKGTPWADGTASISQCAINPGETFVYEFKVDKAGTYFYHGHYGMQRAAGLYGSLIVDLPKEKKEPFPLPYAKEFSLLLSDWWHQSVHEQEVDLSSESFRFIGEPQTLLINGKGQYNCSLAPSDTSAETQCNFQVKTHNNVLLQKQCGPQILNVEPATTYRLRIASTTSLASLNLQIAEHKMTVVEADGNYVEPFEVSDLDIYSGESYSVLITTHKDISKNYWITFGVRGRKPNTRQALALLSYSKDSQYPETKPPTTHEWDDYEHSKSFLAKLKANTNVFYPKPPESSDKVIKLLNTQTKVDNHLRWAINGISLSLPYTPYLGSIKYRLNYTFDQNAPPEYPESYDIMSPNDFTGSRLSSGVYKLIHNKVYDVILQNANMLGKNDHSEIHPWHLHGHDFWVLGYGEGKFSEENKKEFNLKNPPLKNTVSIFPHGWTALRFKADNPGVWAFHCHIEPHLHMGMGVIFVEAIKSIEKMKVPNEAVSCGHTAKFLMNHHHHHHHHRNRH